MPPLGKHALGITFTRDGRRKDCYHARKMHAPAKPPIPLETLLLAYRNGIFPMSDGREDEQVYWVEPRERAIIPLDGFRCSKSLRRVLRSERFALTCDEDFDAVIEACAAPREDHPESWISQPIIDSYRALHRAGHAHSIECWQSGELVGGLYGVAFDQVFCGESMFSRADNASKVALAGLVALMKRAGYRLLDCQFMTDHLASLGAVALPQAKYLELLAAARGQPGMTLPDAYSAACSAAGAGSGSGVGAAVDDGVGADDRVERGKVPPLGKLIAQSFTQTS